MIARTFKAPQPPSSITLTGFDARVPIDVMVGLVTRHPDLEIGLLLSFTPDGRNRYPDRAWLTASCQALAGRCAIHVCGTAARAALHDGQLDDLLAHAPRVQVNGILDANLVEALAERYPTHTIITQLNRYNTRHAAVKARNHALLVDAASRTDKRPIAWERPETTKPVGFAAELGEGQLETTLARISAVDTGPSWVTMEDCLRDPDDWFDLAIAQRVLSIFATYQRKQQAVAQMLAAGPGQSLATCMTEILGDAR